MIQNSLIKNKINKNKEKIKIKFKLAIKMWFKTIVE